MLHQLEFKLHVERQYKEGIDKMAKLYLVDGDKKARFVPIIHFPLPGCTARRTRKAAKKKTSSLTIYFCRADTENKRVESNQKMVLLNQALRRYKTLDVMGDLGEEDDGLSLQLLFQSHVTVVTDHFSSRYSRRRQN